MAQTQLSTTKLEPPAQDHAELPSNLAAEQALLGALLVNNDIFDRVLGHVDESHFFEPLHRQIYSLIVQRISNNRLASPITIKPYLAEEKAYLALGGEDYLLRLAASAIAISAARDYADMIREAAMRRELVNIGEEMVERARRAEIETSPEDQITRAEENLFRLAERGTGSRGFTSFVGAAKQSVDRAKAALERKGSLSGMSTGFSDLDRKLGGLHDSDLIIIAGRPSMGKTALATNMAYNIAHNLLAKREIGGGKVGFFSLEMSAEQLATRVLSSVANIPSHELRTGEVKRAEFMRFVEASIELEKAPLYIDDMPALSIAALAARARRLKRQHGLDVLFVDYLQLVRPVAGKESRVTEVSEITQGLKAIAKDLEIPVVALSQLSRQVEARDDKRPQLSDLRESGSIEQDADVVMFVYREEYYTGRAKPPEDSEKFTEWQEKMGKVHGLAELIIAKQRHGPIGTVPLSFEEKFTRFGDVAPSELRGPD